MAYETAKQQHQMHETGGPSGGGGGGGRGGDGAGVPANVADPSTLLLPERSGNPLLCAVCRDYFREPRLLQCYHTFCARCVRGRVDATQQITCPLCGQMTQLRESPLPPPDLLIEQLIELANSENPPCSNCDVRDKPNMYYCNTCGQALCHHCRENTHRAKMFSTHEVVHASKCAKEPKKCPIHGEQYIMFSSAQKTMLCVNCFRDTAAEQRSFCVDIDSAYAAAVKRLDRAQGGINELQNSIRDGLIMFKNLLDELRQNMESEKHTINTFCQGMQEAIAKTHANMIMEVQRQFETKEKVFRGQLVTLGAVLPTLQLHLMLCAAFANAANKFQFLELAYLMFDRLNTVSQLSHPLRPVQSSTIRTNYRNEFAQSLEPWVGKSVLNPIESSTGNIYESSSIPMIGGQPGAVGATGAPAGATPAGGPFAHPSKRQQSALKTKLLEDETPFSTHCRAFETQIKELCQQVTGVKERLGELHRDVTILRRDNMPPLNVRFECVARDCSLLDESLERHQTELDRMKIIFDALWQEQLCRIHVEQEIFHSQITDIATLRNELHHLSAAAHHLEPFVRNTLDVDAGGGGGATRESNTAAHQHLQSLLEQIGLLQLENLQLKTECKLHPAGASTQAIDLKGGDTIPVKETPKAKTRSGVDAQQRVHTGDQSAGGGGVVVAAATTTTSTEQQKRNVISQLIEKVNRKKSPTDDTRTHAHCSSSGCIKDRERSKSTGSVGPPAATSAGAQPTSKDAKTGGLKQAQKVASSALAQPTATIERLETHIKEKIHDIMNRRQSKSIFEMVSQDSTVSLPGQSSTKMKSATLPLNISDDQKCPKSIEIQMDSAMQQEFASLVHRKLSRSDLDKLALLSQTTRVAPLESKKIGKSCDKINEMKTLKMQTHPHHHVGSIADGISMQKIIGHARRSKTPESAQRYRSKTPPEIGSGVQGAPTSARRSKSGEGSCDKSRSRSKTPPERRSARTHESDYQHIADATTVVTARSDKGKYKQNRSTPSSPKGTSGGASSGTSSRKHKVYPFSDGEDAAEFYRRQRRSGDRSGDSSRGASRENVASSKGNLETKGARQNSFESLSTLSFNSRRSSLENADKTLVLVIGARGNKQSTSGGSNKSLNKQVGASGGSGSRRGSKKGSDRSSDFSSKQRSWETFPPKKHRNNNGVRSYHYCHFATAERSETRQKVRAAAASGSAGATTTTASTSIDKQPSGAATPTGPKKRTAAVAPFVAPPPPATERGGKMVAGTTFMTIGGPRMGHKRHAGHRQQHVVAERGYFSEYELDFDTDDPNDDDDVQDSVFDFDDELNLTFDHRARTAGRPRTSDFRRTGHMSTFKGNEMSTPYQPAGHLSTFKSDSSHALLSTFKGGDASSGPFKSEPYPTPGHMSTFKGDVIAGAPPPSSSSQQQQQQQQQQPHFTTFKGDAPAPFSTFKGDGASAAGGAFKPCFTGYFKGESSQSLSPGSGESSGQSDGTLKKADSFEGHEEAVRTLVAAVQETRTAAARKSK